MDFLELKSRCVGQSNKTLDAICANPAQYAASLKAIRLILDAANENKSGDERTAKLLLNSALVVVGEAFGRAAQAKWVLLNQICGIVSECVDAFDPSNEWAINVIAVERADLNSIAGIVDRILMKNFSQSFEGAAARLSELEKLNKKIRRRVIQAVLFIAVMLVIEYYFFNIECLWWGWRCLLMLVIPWLACKLPFIDRMEKEEVDLRKRRNELRDSFGLKPLRQTPSASANLNRR